MPHFGINQRCFPLSKVCGLRRNGVRHAPYWCAPYAVLLCALRRFMHYIMFCSKVIARKLNLHVGELEN